MGLFSLKVVLILIAEGKNQNTNGPVNAHLTSSLGISIISIFDLNLKYMYIAPG